MKKLIPALLATLLCASAGCDTRIESDVIKDTMGDVFRCEMTGGTPFSSGQANVIRSVVRVINTSECWFKTGESYSVNNTCEAYDNFVKTLKEAGVTDGLSLNEFDSVMEGTKKSLSGGTISYNTKAMSNIYKVVEGLVSDSSGDSSTMYCACGYEFCESGASCVVDTATNLPICTYSTSLGQSVDSTCDPVLIKNTSVSSVVPKALYPILWKLSSLQGNLASNKYKIQTACVSKQEAEADQTICSNGMESGYGYLFYQTADEYAGDSSEKKTRYENAADFFSFFTTCVNYDASSVESYAHDNQNLPEDLKAVFKDSNVTVTKVYYKKGSKGEEHYFPICIGDQVHFPGVHTGATTIGYYFSIFRTLVKQILTYHLADADLAKVAVEDNLEKKVDEFIIQFIAAMVNSSEKFSTDANKEIFNYFANGVVVPEYGVSCYRDAEKPSLCDATKPVLDNSVIMDIVQKYLKLTFSAEGKMTLADDVSSYYDVSKMGRLFFAYLADFVNSFEDGYASSLNSSFSVNLDCATPISGIGDPAGVKKYCSADDNILIGVKNIIDSLEEDVDPLDKNKSRVASQKMARASLIELILMGTAGEIPVDITKVRNKNGDGFDNLAASQAAYVTINSAASKKTISFKSNTESGDITGKWLVMRCPGGASCGANGQCGDCANTETGITTTLYRLATAAEKSEHKLGDSFDDYIKFENASCVNGAIVGTPVWPSK